MKNKKGISLIVLIITIIVMIILVSAVVLNFFHNNPIGIANEAKFKSDLNSFREQLSVTHTDKSIADADYVEYDINVDAGNFAKMKIYIPDITEYYANKLLIRNGKLLYIGDESNSNYKKQEEDWAKQISIPSPYANLGDADGDGYVTEEDCNYIQNYLAKIIEIESMSARQEKAMDVDGNGKINFLDIEQINKYLNGIDSTIYQTGG